MTSFTMELPEEVFSASHQTPDEFVGELRLAAAIYWYSRGEISMERAAMIAGLDRNDFLGTLAQNHIDVFKVDLEDLKQELKIGINAT